MSLQDHANLISQRMLNIERLWEITDRKPKPQQERAIKHGKGPLLIIAVELVKTPEEGYYQVSAADDMVVRKTGARPPKLANKSFHLDTYCFDSKPERELFWSLLKNGKVQKLYFTGMLTHGQSEFFVQYIDPESHTIRSYYPDFLFQKDDGTSVIVEVKGDDKIEDLVVLAKKEFAEQIAGASGMTYRIIKISDAIKGHYSSLLEQEDARSNRAYL